MADAEHNEKVIFVAASKITDPEERDEFLEFACRGDAALRQRVDALLQLSLPADDFFRVNPRVLCENPEAELIEHTLREPGVQPGLIDAENIDRYRLVSRLGEGGCGVVYRAEQTAPVRRQVALKIIRLGMDTESVIARFEAERQALALMDHPNIARVLDAGATQSGRPFFAMELVSGTKVTQYCDEQHRSVTQRLEVFIEICSAIQHAHQKGIIHRDIKPSNILVSEAEGRAVPKVIDFGIAKATQGRLSDNTLYTAQDQFVGTPAYMSPEQADGSHMDVDTRADIYSLGVLLYELLTGRPPFDSKELSESGLDVMRRTLREREPLRPSAMLNSLKMLELEQVAANRATDPHRLFAAVRGDLDWIVMKALEKDRQRRYETANGLAMDVRRFLDNEPIVARPPSRLYRLQKTARRNRVAFAAVSVVVVALAAGLGAATISWKREKQARERAVAAEQQQIKLREEADRLRQQAEYRQRLTEATVLLSRRRIQEADRLVAGIPAPEPNLEYANLFRALGDWHCLYMRWQPAVERFSVLVKVNQPRDWDVTTLDYLRLAPLFVELNDAKGYDQFRNEALAVYAGTENPLAAERIVKASLLSAADHHLLIRLQPLVEVVTSAIPETGKTDPLAAAWWSFSVALFEYRKGDIAEAKRWCEASRRFRATNPARTANLRVLESLVQWRSGHLDSARRTLSETRGAIDAHLKKGVEFNSSSEGHWFDWLFAHVLWREANGLISSGPQTR